jgi:hypothetical protein
MKTPLNMTPSRLREQATDTYLRARKLPPGPHRNDLRQLAFGLLRLHKLGIRANARVLDGPTGHPGKAASVGAPFFA